MFRVQVYRIDPKMTPHQPHLNPARLDDIKSSTLYPAIDLAKRCALRFNESQLASPTGLWAVVADEQASRR